MSDIVFNNVKFISIEEVNNRLSFSTSGPMMGASSSGSHDAIVVLGEQPGGVQGVCFYGGIYRFSGERPHGSYTLPKISHLLDFNGGDANLIAPALVGVNASDICFHPDTINIVKDIGECYPVVFFGGDNFDIKDGLRYDHVLQYVVGDKYSNP